MGNLAALGCLFELERADLDELMKREHRYEVHEVDAYELPSEPAEGMILDARNFLRCCVC